MGGQITSHSDQDAAACNVIIPFAKLPDACLKHLVGVKTGVFTQQHVRQCLDQNLGRVAEEQVTGDETCGAVDLLLPIESIQESSTDVLDRRGKIIEAVALLAWQRRRRHVQIACQVEGHRPV